MIKFPVFLKIPCILMGLIAFVFILHVGGEILKPLVFALILAILLNPVVNMLTRLGVGRVLSITCSVLLLIVLVAGILFFIGSQITRFREALPELEQKSLALSQQVMDWASEKFHVPQEKINQFIEEKKKEGLSSAGGMVGTTLVSISGILVTVLLVPVYIFLFLFYKPLLLNFIGRVFSSDKHRTVSEILASTKSTIQNYLLGLLFEMAIIATLNSVALLIIGVDYAIVLGLVGAILNLIPYIGGLIAISLPILMALITGTPAQALFVLGAYMLIQLVDNNFLVPKVVASKVKVNALVSIVVVLVWGAIWGVAGMFLSIPLTAIMKVVFDRVKPLKPYGYLLGDTMPPIGAKFFRIGHLHRSPENRETRPVRKAAADGR